MFFACVCLGGIGSLEPLENHIEVYNCMHFHGLDPFGAESVSGSAFGTGPACVFEDLGADWDTHWDSI